MAAQSRATLPHHCPDRAREKTEHRGLYLLFLCLPSCPGRKERDTRRAEERKGKLERKREGERGRCLTAVNWRRLYPTNISEKEGEKRKRDFIPFYSQRGCLRVYISFFGGQRREENNLLRLFIYAYIVPSLWRGGKKREPVLGLFFLTFVSGQDSVICLDSGLVPLKHQVRGCHAPI